LNNLPGLKDHGMPVLRQALNVGSHNMTPPFPIITIYHGNVIDILNGDYPLDQTTLYGYIKHKTDNSVYYDRNGLKWTSSIYSPKYKRTLLTRLLANTFYNPTIKVERTWEEIGPYKLAELIEKVNHYIDLDDDILTQFSEGSKLKTKVSQSESFEELVQLLFDYVFKPTPR
jgi:hypothetical protein